MQQTTKYKLNLIEKTDTFSPDAMNQNMEKVEAALESEAAARAAADAALDQRLQVFEATQIAFGTYDGGREKNIVVGFTPKVVLIQSLTSEDACHMLLRDDAPYKKSKAEIVEGGFKLYPKDDYSSNVNNNSGYRYWYLALA